MGPGKLSAPVLEDVRQILLALFSLFIGSFFPVLCDFVLIFLEKNLIRVDNVGGVP
jgi:hypothetical protein